jgi:hypothetical protein
MLFGLMEKPKQLYVLLAFGRMWFYNCTLWPLDAKRCTWYLCTDDKFSRGTWLAIAC